MKIHFLIFIICLLSTSCAYVKSNRIITFEYDNKTVVLKAPEGYCFYDENKPIEADIAKVVRTSNYSVTSKVEFIFQECKEKDNFLGNKKPQFRSTGMIIFSLPDYLKQLKKYGLERSREVYIRYEQKAISSDTVKDMNKLMKEDIIPTMKQKNDLKIIDKSTNLTKEQKRELKLVHNQVFGKSEHIFLSSYAKLELDEAVYDHQEYQVGEIVTKCVGGITLMNYIPITFVICEDKKSESWKDLEDKIQKYVRLMLKLNDDM